MRSDFVNDSNPPNSRWYSGITSYQWLVLVIASLGWVFDVFEGQMYPASVNEVVNDLVEGATAATQDRYRNVGLGAFLAGGAVGGILFGALGDRIGRARTMSLTILVYSLFTCLTALAQEMWQVVALRFLVALGVGGEWAVASAMVSEVFPPRARAWSGAIFHGSSVLGTFLAVAAGQFLVGNEAVGWRIAFLVGALPAVLTLWIRLQLKEPERWVADHAVDAAPQPAGRILELFAPGLARRTVVGFSLAAVGLATFWGVHLCGKDFALRRARSAAEQREGLSESASEADRQAAWKKHPEIKGQEMWGMFLTTIGGGLGLLAFGPFSEWLGRRGAFAVYHLGGLVMAVLLFKTYRHWDDAALTALLPMFGFWTLGMHAGYAIYFPELYPTRIRSLGSGFCFNCARFCAAAILIVMAFARDANVSFETIGASASLLFLLGLVIVPFGPETKGSALAS